MKLKLFQVDAFTDHVFGGNPAAVCPLDNWLEDHILQQIALENNLSETAFFVKNVDDTYQLRWFTPLKEVDLCGHATLASAHVIFTYMDYQDPEIIFRSRSGDLRVKRSSNGYSMDFPADYPEETSSEGLEAILGVPVKGAWKGVSDLLVEVADQPAVQKLNPDFRAMAALPFRGVIVTAPGTATDIVSRCFYPAYGVDEDPVTGSAHTTLFSFWGRRWGRDRLTASQLSRRGGRVGGEIRGERIILSGEAVSYLIGEIVI